MVAIKIMRRNDMMQKAAEKEVEILKKLNRADKDGQKHVIRLFGTFFHREHLCLSFECMWDNLRVALKKYTNGRGMSLQAVRAYTKQLLVGLAHIHRCNFIHADIKPDNLLISAGHNVVKICDLGSALELTQVEATSYIVSRFYRAPEIILGKEATFPVDVFAMGASLCELFTGGILLPGRSNNDMLRVLMELKGKLPHKLIKSGPLWKKHFDDNLDFKWSASGPKKNKEKVLTDLSATKDLTEIVLHRIGPERRRSEKKEDQIYVKKAKQFAELVGQMIAHDPERRITAANVLQHPFVSETWPGTDAKGSGKGA